MAQAILKISMTHSGSGSGRIGDGFNPYPGRLLGRPALSLPVLEVRRRLVCHIHGGSSSVLNSVLTVHTGTSQRPGDKDVCHYDQCHSGKSS